MSCKIIGHIYFSGRTQQCIVLTQDEITSEIKARIACVSGADPDIDLKYTQDWGSKFDADVAFTLINRHGSYTISEKEWLELQLMIK